MQRFLLCPVLRAGVGAQAAPFQGESERWPRLAVHLLARETRESSSSEVPA